MFKFTGGPKGQQVVCLSWSEDRSEQLLEKRSRKASTIKDCDELCKLICRSTCSKCAEKAKKAKNGQQRPQLFAEDFGKLLFSLRSLSLWKVPPRPKCAIKGQKACKDPQRHLKTA